MQYAEKIRTAVDSEIDEIFEACFPMWIDAAWYWISGYKRRHGFTFEECKEAFFYLLERLLKEGKVTFDHPDKLELWGESPEVMLDYFRSHWPRGVTTEGDIELTTYFYQMPGVSWLGHDGEWHGS